tara:strand:- start:21 stop:122 length:102 start_codon:yes stop_codon:yes gene_type:complete
MTALFAKFGGKRKKMDKSTIGQPRLVSVAGVLS